MMRRNLVLVLFSGLLMLLAGMPARAASSVVLNHVTVSVALKSAPRAGTTDWAAIHFDIAPGWHTYWRNPGETGYATDVHWSLPKGVSAGAIHWPAPKRFADAGIVNYGYAHAATLLVPLTFVSGAKLSGSATAKVSWLLCAHMCIPQSAVLRLPLDRASGDASLVQTGLGALPKTFDGQANVSVSGQAVTVRFMADALRSVDPANVAFFPAKPGIVRYDVPVKVQKNGDAIDMRFARAQHAKPVAQLAGVLELGGGRNFAVTASAPALAPVRAPATADATFDLASAALFAFLGGLILNLMPCVLPILSMKALALARSGERAPQMRRDGLAYAVGVVVSFVAMAFVLIALKSAGAAIGWGFQLQSPFMILVLWLLTTAIGLNLLGLYEVPLQLAGMGGHLTQGDTALSAFFTGVLAVLVASPCTAPFMGAALGYAMTQPPYTALSVFLALGLGFALPLTLFAFIPAMARIVPKPGTWMIRFKEFLAFPMLATGIWLLWVLERQTGIDGVVMALSIGLGIVFLIWLVRSVKWPALRWTFAVLGAAGLFALSFGLRPAVASRSQTGSWVPWSAAAVASAREAGHPVLVDLSAAWCVSCLVNERIALHNPSVERHLQRDGVVTLKGDWTSRDPAITALLARYGRAGVPLYLLYPAAPSARAIVLPQILTPDVVNAALNKLKPMREAANAS